MAGMAQLASTQRSCLLLSKQGDSIQNGTWIWSWPVLTPSWWPGTVWLIAGQGQHAELRSRLAPVLFSSTEIVYRISYIVAGWKDKDPEEHGGVLVNCVHRANSVRANGICIWNFPHWHLALMFWRKRGVDAAWSLVIEIPLAANFLRQVAYLIPTESKRKMEDLEHELCNLKRSCLQGTKLSKNIKDFVSH